MMLLSRIHYIFPEWLFVAGFIALALFLCYAYYVSFFRKYKEEEPSEFMKAIKGELKPRKLLRNAIKCPDGTILESRSRWDYKSHVDELTKLNYVVDGGLDYRRRSIHHGQEDLCLYSDSPHEVLREHVTWGTYGKNGDEPLRLVAIRDMTNNHLEAVISTQKGSAYSQILELMQAELDYRKENNITL